MTDRTIHDATSQLESARGDTMGSELAARVAHLEVVQTTQLARGKPWYRQASVIIAALALVLSITATWLGEQRAGERDEAAARVELSQLIQRLASLPRENEELKAQYAGDPTTFNSLSGSISTENAVLAQQASDVIARIPAGVSGSEYVAVGQALVLTGNYARAETVLDAGLAHENDASALAALWRTKGALYFSTLDLTQARAAMQHALDAFADQQRTVAAAADVYTEWQWASGEQALGDCEASREHLQRARGYLDELPQSPYKTQMILTLFDTENNAASAACASP